MRGLQRPLKEGSEEQEQSHGSVVLGEIEQSDLEIKRGTLGLPRLTVAGDRALN